MSDAMDWSPGECCRSMAQKCDAEDADACVIVRLNRGPNSDLYNVGISFSGLRYSEAVALLEVAKANLLKELTG